jgi:hypothetical protein
MENTVFDIQYVNGKFRAIVGGNCIAESANKEYCKRLAKQRMGEVANRSVSLEESVAVNEFNINDRFMFTEQLVKMVANHQTPSCIITGEGGLGKSYTVIKALRDAGMKDVSEIDPGEVVLGRDCFRIIKGFSTAKGLYRVLFENQNSVVVFDDCDSVLKDPDALNLLKGALDSFDKRLITWNTSLDGDSLPRMFQFKGGVVFISNLPVEKISQALRTRSMNVDLSMTAAQKLERMETIMQSDEFMPDIPLSFKQDALNTIQENQDRVKDLSLRTLITVSKIRASGNTNWQDLAKYMLVA